MWVSEIETTLILSVHRNASSSGTVLTFQAIILSVLAIFIFVSSNSFVSVFQSVTSFENYFIKFSCWTSLAMNYCSIWHVWFCLSLLCFLAFTIWKYGFSVTWFTSKSSELALSLPYYCLSSTFSFGTLELFLFSWCLRITSLLIGWSSLATMYTSFIAVNAFSVEFLGRVFRCIRAHTK